MGADDMRAVQFGQIMGGMFQVTGAHVLGGRVDQVAGQRLGGRDPLEPGGIYMHGRDKSRIGRRLVAIAREPVAPRTGSPVQSRWRGDRRAMPLMA